MTLTEEDLKFVRYAKNNTWTTDALNSMLWSYAEMQMAEEGINCASCVQKLFKQLKAAAEALESQDTVSGGNV